VTPLPADRLREAAERWGTPLYVTDLDVASAAAQDWRDALPGALIAYAVKANPDPALLRRLAGEGFGFEVVGPIELALALRAGGTPDRIVVNGVGQTDADLADALTSGAPQRSAASRRNSAGSGVIARAQILSDPVDKLTPDADHRIVHAASVLVGLRREGRSGSMAP